MDNLSWFGGKNLKATIEASGRRPTLTHYAVVMILAAREQGKTLEDIVQELILANDYDAAASKLDKSSRIRELGF